MIRCWLTPPADEQFDAKVTDIWALYQAAPTLAEQGDRIMSMAELTGVQALERKHPGLPLAPGHLERREFEYVRQGTCSFILSRDVVSGAVLAPTDRPTRTEADFLAHVQGVVATDPAAPRWHFVVDNLDIHRSASLVRWVAAPSGLGALDQGEKGKRGILATRETRAAFWSDPSHCGVLAAASPHPAASSVDESQLPWPHGPAGGLAQAPNVNSAVSNISSADTRGRGRPAGRCTACRRARAPHRRSFLRAGAPASARLRLN